MLLKTCIHVITIIISLTNVWHWHGSHNFYHCILLFNLFNVLVNLLLNIDILSFINFYWIYTYISWREVHSILLAISEFCGGWVIMEDCEWRIYILAFWSSGSTFRLLKFLLTFMINILWDHFYWNLLNIVKYIHGFIHRFIHGIIHRIMHGFIHGSISYIFFYTFYTNLYMLCYIACDILWFLLMPVIPVMWYILWCSADVCWCLTIWNFIILYCDVIISVMHCDLYLNFYRKFYMDHLHWWIYWWSVICFVLWCLWI